MYAMDKLASMAAMFSEFRGPPSSSQGRSVVFSYGYAQEAKGKRAPNARGTMGVWGHAPLEKFYL